MNQSIDPAVGKIPPEPEVNLHGRVAVVTGAGSRAPGIGNGRASAILLARRGAKVALLDDTVEWAQETLRMIEAEGGTAAVFRCDVAQDEQCRATVNEIVARWGRIDILVNNVGISGPTGDAVDLDLAAWDAAMRVNVTAMVLMARHCIPHMRRLGHGAIVNVASVAGLIGGHPSLLYPTSKGAVVNLTRAMAAQHGREGIRVNCVAPGLAYIPAVEAKGISAEKREARKKRSLLHTEGTGWDTGHAITFLCTDAARWITGVILPVDAGVTAGQLSP